MERTPAEVMAVAIVVLTACVVETCRATNINFAAVAWRLRSVVARDKRRSVNRLRYYHEAEQLAITRFRDHGKSAVSMCWGFLGRGQAKCRGYCDDVEPPLYRRDAWLARLCSRRRIRSQKTGDGVLLLDSH